MWSSSFVDDHRVADICLLTYHDERKKWTQGIRNMQMNLQSNLNDRLEDLSSRLFPVLDLRLFQVTGEYHQKSDEEGSSTVKNQVEKKTMYEEQRHDHKQLRLYIDGYGSVPVD